MKNIIIKPILTEKMTTLGERGQYAFVVDKDANKIQIAGEIEQRFNVTVVSIRTMNFRGKTKTQMTKRGRFEGRRAHWKKAIVTVAKDQKIELIEA